MVVVLPLAYACLMLALQRRRGRDAMARWPAAASMLRGASRHPARRAAFAIWLLALAAMGFGAAGPQARIPSLAEQSTLMLAMDVSGSMEATDIAPTRLAASQSAAQALVQGLPSTVQVGIVTFSDSATLVQAPTRDRAVLAAALAGIGPQGGTAIGDGIMASLSAIFAPARADPQGETSSGQPDPRSRQPVLARALADSRTAQPGSFRSAAVVLLTDGQNTDGVDPLDAADVAARLGVRVFTIGFGTRKGVVAGATHDTVRVPADQEILRLIAQRTGAEYRYADSGERLTEVYRHLSSRLEMDLREIELSGPFALLAALLSITAAGLSLAFTGRVA